MARVIVKPEGTGMQCARPMCGTWYMQRNRAGRWSDRRYRKGWYSPISSHAGAKSHDPIYVKYAIRSSS